MVPGALAAPATGATGSSAHVAGKRLTTNQVIAALAHEGVGVYATPTSPRPLRPITAPVVPVRMLKSQAAALAAQTVVETGVTGAALNSLVAMPSAPEGKRYPSFDYLVAAYAMGHATPGEKLAGELLAHANLDTPDTVVFPSLILTLMAADLDRAGTRGRHSTRIVSGGLAVAHIASGSLCSTLSDWVSQSFDSLFKALSAGSSSSGALNFIGGLWNSALSLARSAIANLASTLTAPVIGAIKRGLAVAGVVSWAVSALSNLKVTSTAAPPYNEFGVEPSAGNDGALTIKLGSAGGFDFPQGLKDCASLLGIELPSFNSVAGRTVSWSLAQVNGVPASTWCTSSSCDLASENTGETDTTLSAAHTATFHYTTNVETPAQSAGALITSDFILVSGTVSLDKQALTKLIDDIVLGQVPGAVRVVFQPMLDALTSRIAGQIASLAEPSFFRYVQIEHHGTPCLVGDWTVTSVNDGAGPGAGATFDWGPDGVVTADYDDSQPSPGGEYFTGEESANYVLTASSSSGEAGLFSETPLSGGLTYYSNGQATYSPAGPESGTWTCSGDSSTITEQRANGTDVWVTTRDGS